MSTERKLHSNWRSPADTPSLSPTVAAGLHVRYSRHRSSPETFFFSENLFVNRFVRDESRSWNEVPLYLNIVTSTQRNTVRLSWSMFQPLLNIFIDHIHPLEANILLGSQRFPAFYGVQKFILFSRHRHCHYRVQKASVHIPKCGEETIAWSPLEP
jgi:hypothetical protein